MNDFAGMEDLLSDFLLEAGEMLSEVDSKLMDLEEFPEDSKLLNEIFRGFHTIKGGAGFLNASELVALCHIIENLFDKLRNRELVLGAELMDVIFAATAEVRRMFGALQQGLQPGAAPGEVIDALKAVLTGQQLSPLAGMTGLKTGLRTEEQAVPGKTTASQSSVPGTASAQPSEVDWGRLYKALTGTDFIAQVRAKHDPKVMAAAISGEDTTGTAFGLRDTGVHGSATGRPEGDVSAKEAMDSIIPVETDRLDKVLNLSGEISLAKNRLTRLCSAIIQGRNDADTMHELDQAVSQMDMLVVNLQNAVMKTRKQPIGRLFKKYLPLARDLARSLGKDVDLVLAGGDTEMDTTMIEAINEPLAHIVRNAVDHGVETVEGRIAAGKPEKSIVELSARQKGDHILISITDDGRGMRPEVIRNKAIEKGLITREMANTLDETRCLELVFLPGFAAGDGTPGVPGRGSGMDAVKTGIQKLNGVVNIRSEPGKGTVITILLPLTLATLPVLMLRLGEQSFAVPLSMVREILSVTPEKLQQVSGRATMVVRGELLPVLPLAQLIGWEQSGTHEVGVLIQFGDNSFILLADSFAGHDDVVIKPLDTFRPRGVAGVTISGGGDIVLILDIKELLSDVRAHY
ncbi:MAG: chemotaxis protein CheA [Gallionellales bacterium RIFCSPHIGHO2_02_FULL_57_16]|nr:MAG: chemotaxis protein CheA [Gallionellales bacterium RIFCSPHIGHO2_02_FULL_57_16]